MLMNARKPQLYSFVKRKGGKRQEYFGASLQKNQVVKAAKLKNGFLVATSICLVVVGLYLAYLLLTPKLPILAGPSEIDLNTADDATDNRDRIQIEKINLEVPFFTGSAEELDKGAWHRYPDRGDPKDGGNFILSAHRFSIGTTPAETKKRSPFYNLEKLEVGDTMRIFYQDKWYTYTVTKKYNVKPNATEIEAPSETSKLTLYSCSLNGSADGRIVIEATTKDGPSVWQHGGIDTKSSNNTSQSAKANTPSASPNHTQADQLKTLFFGMTPSPKPKKPSPSTSTTPSSDPPTSTSPPITPEPSSPTP